MLIKTPKVAVLMAAYNGVRWIDEQINSILSQEGVDVYLFISVDLSSDSTFQLCENWVKENSRIHLLPYGTRFGGAAKNFYRLVHDVDATGFDFVALSDQDDIWLPLKLLTACDKISSDFCDVYSSNVIAFWRDGRKILIKKSDPQRNLDYFFESGGPGCTYVFSQQAYLDVQQFVITNYEDCLTVDLHDWLFYAYCRGLGYNWYIDSKALVLYRQHDLNQVGSNNGFAAYLKRFRMIREGWYRGEVLKIASLVSPKFSKLVGRRLFLIKNCFQLRRRLRDRISLLFFLIMGWF